MFFSVGVWGWFRIEFNTLFMVLSVLRNPTVSSNVLRVAGSFCSSLHRCMTVSVKFISLSLVRVSVVPGPFFRLVYLNLLSSLWHYSRFYPTILTLLLV